MSSPRDIRWLRHVPLALVFVLACKEGTSPSGDTSLPVLPPVLPPPEGPPALVMQPGDSAFLSYGSEPAKRLGIKLTAGDTIDIGLWVPPSNNLSYPGLLQRENGLPALPLANAVREWPQNSGETTIYPGIIVPATGTYQFSFSAGSYVYRGTPSGSVHVRVRKSGPIVLVADRGGAAFSSYGGAINSRSTPDAELMDTLWVRNVGSGSATVRMSGILVRPESVSVQGPSSGWTTAQGAAALVLRKKSLSSAGLFFDTLTFSGFPEGPWSTRAVPFVRVASVVQEPDASLHSLTQSISDLAVNQRGEILMGGAAPLSGASTVFRLEANGALSAIATFPGQAMSGTGFAVGPDTAIYSVRNTSGSSRTLNRISASGAHTVVMNDVPGTMVVVLPDMSMYFGHINANTLTRRSPTGAVQPVTTYAPTGPYFPLMRGLLFNPVDSALYLMLGTKLVRRDLRTQTEDTIGTFGNSTPSFVDTRGHLYLDDPVASSLSVLLVVDRTGAVVERRYPPANVTRVVVRGDTVFGAFGNAILGTPSNGYWTLPPRTGAVRR